MTRADSLHAQIAAMRERCDAATEGPWKSNEFNPIVASVTSLMTKTVVAGSALHNNAAFIANARTDMPNLLAAVEAVVGVHEPYNYEGRRVVISRNGRERWVPHTYILCAGCEANSHGEYSTDWPCPTITAVTSALGGA